MAKKSGNGHDPVVTAIHELTARVVERLSALETGQAAIEQLLRGHGRQLEALHTGQKETNARLAKVEDGLSDVRDELHGGLGKVSDRLDNIRDFAGERYREQGEGLRSLGERVAKLEARVPETR